jgi:hypothetical protein
MPLLLPLTMPELSVPATVLFSVSTLVTPPVVSLPTEMPRVPKKWLR